MYLQVGKDVLCDRAKICNLVSRERSSAKHSSHSLCSGGVENLTLSNRRTVARVDCSSGGSQEGGKIARTFRIGGQRRDV